MVSARRLSSPHSPHKHTHTWWTRGSADLALRQTPPIYLAISRPATATGWAWSARAGRRSRRSAASSPSRPGPGRRARRARPLGAGCRARAEAGAGRRHLWWAAPVCSSRTRPGKTAGSCRRDSDVGRGSGGSWWRPREVGVRGRGGGEGGRREAVAAAARNLRHTRMYADIHVFMSHSTELCLWPQ